MSNQITDTIFKDCPIRSVLAHICGKWSMLVLCTIHAQGKAGVRFNILHKNIPDISQKVLTSTLRSLEADGMVERRVFAEVPPRVEYSLTDRGNSFIPLVGSLVEWAKDNMAGIKRDRMRSV